MTAGKAIGIGLCLAAGVSLAADELVLSGDYPVTVASGTTQNLSQKITGTGRLIVLGGGTLVLDNGDNDFTGGVIVSNGVLQADAKGAFGTGPITLEGTAAVRTVNFNAKGATFSNSITVKDAGTSGTYPAVIALKTVTLDGDIGIDPALAAANTAAYFHIKAGTSTADDGVVYVTLNGDFDCGAARPYFLGYGDFYMRGKLTGGACYFGSSSSEVGSVALYNPENSIGAIHLYTFDIFCRANNVFKGAFVQFDWAGTWYANGHGFIVLGGYDQEIAYSHSAQALINVKPNGYACGFLNDATAAPMSTLTIVGTPAGCSGGCYGRLAGKIALRLQRNYAADLYQGFLQRSNSMTGGITVDGGQLRVRNGAIFTAVTNITVNGGSLTFEAATNAFPVLRSLVVNGSGTVRCDADSETPIYSRDAIVELAAGAHLYMGRGQTNTVRRLVVDGMEMKAGTYTRENLPQMVYASSPGSYPGALVVLSGPRGMVFSFR